MRKKALLAASFVVTAAGCNREADSPPIHTNNPPAPTTTATPTTTTTAPPTADEPNVHIEQMADGTCMRFVAPGPCPPGAMCNPPPPMKVPCPDAGATATPTVPTDPTSNVTIEQMPNGKCMRIVHVTCPTGVMCNPPPPKEVPCPDAGTGVS